MRAIVLALFILTTFKGPVFTRPDLTMSLVCEPVNRAAKHKDIFPDEVDVRSVGMRGSSRVFKLLSDFRANTRLGALTLTSGFLTDGASIPKIFWSLMDPWGPWFEAALVHDWLYSKNSGFEHTRKQADLVLLDLMKTLEVPWIKRQAIHKAVRLGGWVTWSKRRG